MMDEHLNSHKSETESYCECEELETKLSFKMQTKNTWMNPKGEKTGKTQLLYLPL